MLLALRRSVSSCIHQDGCFRWHLTTQFTGIITEYLSHDVTGKGLAPRDYAEGSERVSVESRAGKREKRISGSSNKLHISFLFPFQARLPTYTAQIVVSMKSRLRTPAIFCAV